jgi:hypothetical protein
MLETVERATADQKEYGDQWRLRNADKTVMQTHLKEAFGHLKRAQFHQERIGRESQPKTKGAGKKRIEVADPYAMSTNGQMVRNNILQLVERQIEVDEALEDQNILVLLSGLQMVAVE